MKITPIFNSLLLGLLLTANANANAIPAQVVGYTEANVIINNAEKTSPFLSRLKAAAVNTSTETSSTKLKHILLQRIVLSHQAQTDLEKRVNTLSANSLPLTPVISSLHTKEDIGMNNVPVLDQGIHGTCATFAATAIIDAAYAKGDYISQLCNLELTDFIYPSKTAEHEGWDGSTNTVILNQMKKYGIISKTYQTKYGCGGMYEYPLNNPVIGKPMPDTLFTQHSEKILETMPTKTLFDINTQSMKNRNSTILLQNVKQALLDGHRVVIGFLLDDNDGSVGAFGKYQTILIPDSWIITPGIVKNTINKKIKAGHAIVITGYDDNAVITGPNNTKHTGVLRLRNSWGDEAGYYGDYFMSYSYFKTFAIEIIEVSPTI